VSVVKSIDQRSRRAAGRGKVDSLRAREPLPPAAAHLQARRLIDPMHALVIEHESGTSGNERFDDY